MDVSASQCYEKGTSHILGKTFLVMLGLFHQTHGKVRLVELYFLIFHLHRLAVSIYQREDWLLRF